MPFTVSGLTAGETGAVTFTDTADHQVVVSVAANGTYSADLSGLTDGTITSSLWAADAAGDSATASGNAVTLDTDSALKPSLSVDATNPAHVTFTVSGLESDYSGTVTFTDASGNQDVVPIESNGAYSANLSNLANGTITYLLSASDPAGNVITVDPPLNLGDGSANAPAGTPQYPHLLDVNSPSTQTYGENYVTRPAWNVAGADYAVGVPAGVTLKDPTPGGVLAAALVAQGCSLSGAEIICNGNNQTISGWDFSLHGGYQLQINGSGDTVANNNFALGANHASVGALIGVGGSAKNTTIVDNTLNGNGLINQSIGLGLIDSDGTGTTTIEYNQISNAYSENIVIGNNSTSGENLVIQYNLIENGGLGFNGGAHGDWIQIVNGSSSDIINSEAINFNTWMQTVPMAVGRTQGITFPSTGQVLSASYQNNTFIGVPGAYVNYAILIDPSHLNGSATVANNYYDMSGIGSSNGGTTAGWIDVGALGGTAGPYNGTVNTSNNVNMLTGTYFTQNETSVRQVLTSPSSGTELAGNTITLTVDFSAAVTVTGTPTLTFNDGGTATYVGGSGTNALAFSYTVGASDGSVSALAITQVNLPGGATIKDGSGNAADLTNALTTFWNLAIDQSSPGPTLSSIAESPSTGDLNAGNTVTLTLNYSGAVTVAGGTPTLTLNDGGTATYTGGSGTSALTFSYTVGAGQNTASLAATAVNLNGATLKDGSGNAASLSLTGLTQAGPQIDTTTPVISAIAETPSSGDLNAGKTVTYTLTMSEAVTVNTTGGSPTLTLNDGGTATYTGGSGTNALTFSYTVLAGQNTPDLMVSAVNLNGATLLDGAGNAANLSLTGLTQGSPQIDTTPPTVSSVVASGTGITAGAGDLAAGSVVTLTVNLSEAVTVAGGTPTLTLNDGGTATYTGGSGSDCADLQLYGRRPARTPPTWR